MPLPKPRKKETQQEYIRRCRGDNMMTEEYKNQKQRAASCYTQFKDRIKNKGEASWDDVRKGDTLNLI